MEEKDKKSLLDDLQARVLSLKGYLKDNKVSSVQDVVKLINFLIRFVEDLSRKEEIQKADKEEIVIDLINRLVDIPKIPEFAERLIIQLVVKSIVEALNQNLGKNWISRVHLS